MSLKRMGCLLSSVSLLLFGMCEITVDTTSDNIEGKWYVTQYIEVESYTEEGDTYTDSDTDYVSYLDEIMVIDPSTMTMYDKDDDCYSVDEIGYTLSGNSLLGEEFNDQYTEDGVTYKISSTASVSGDQLKITITYDESGSDESGYEKETIILKRYYGAVVPNSWPSEECSYLDKKVFHKKKFAKK